MTQFTRPTRGITRLDTVSWDPAPLAADMAVFTEDDWHALEYGTKWGHIQLVAPNPDGRGSIDHPKLAECPAIREVMDSFGSRVLDVSLARLGPGGQIAEHRDISGGVPMGVGRFHVPIVTHPDVEFYVSGHKVFLGPGELWTLDTTYKHKLHNRSDVLRIHLIVDVELNDAVKAMLPKLEPQDLLHRAYFGGVVATKGLKLLVKDPRQLKRMTKKFFKLLILRESVLTTDD